MTPGEGLRVFDAGVLALRVTAGWYQTHEWSRPTPCAGWDAHDVAGHVVGVIGWYHDWLDRAEAGDASPPFGPHELAARNAEALASLTVDGGPQRIATFAARAQAYALRVRERWDLPYGYPRGTVTAGEHAGMAAAEWHLHAWDLSRAIGRDHRAADAALLVEAIRSTGREVPERTDPWESLLRMSGRDPGWTPG